MTTIETTCFQIIAAVGTARSQYIEAIEEAKKGNIDIARRMVQEGNETFREGHRAHAGLLQMEASGDQVQVTLLMLHAQDLLMSAENFKIIAVEFIDLYALMHEKITPSIR